jgi:hypothetical protein
LDLRRLAWHHAARLSLHRRRARALAVAHVVKAGTSLPPPASSGASRAMRKVAQHCSAASARIGATLP